MNLDHLHLQAENLQASSQFYEKFFQFKSEHLPNGTTVVLRNKNNFFLMLEKTPTLKSLPRWFHIGFGCQNEDELRTLLKQMKNDGVKILKELDCSTNPANFYCCDPAGNRIEAYWFRSE